MLVGSNRGSVIKGCLNRQGRSRQAFWDMEDIGLLATGQDVELSAQHQQLDQSVQTPPGHAEPSKPPSGKSDDRSPLLSPYISEARFPLQARLHIALSVRGREDSLLHLMFGPARAKSDAQKRRPEARATFYELLHSSMRLPR